MTLDGLIDLLDEAGEKMTASLAERGYDTVEWATSRGGAPTFGDDDDHDDY
jgi:hypothetical protein